jgi:hypothetical protein
MAYYPLQVEKIARAVRSAGGGARRGARARVYDAEELGCSTSTRARPRRARRTDRARAAAEAPDFIPLVRSWGGVTIAYRKRMVDSPAYRLNHEEVIKALEEGIAFAENLNPSRRCPIERGGAVADLRSRDAAGAHGAGRGRNDAEHAYEKEAPEHSSSMRRRNSFSRTPRPSNGDGTLTLAPDPDGFFTSYQSTAAASATTATTTRATPATSSRRWRRRRTVIRSARLFARELSSSTTRRSRHANAPGAR